MTRFGLDKPIDRCGLGIEYLNGAVTRVPVDATAFAHRNARQNFLIFGSWDEPSQNEVGMRWSNELWQSMKPFIANRVYVNYMNEGESDRVASAYGENYQRLVTVKNKYDPSNFFRSNLSIASTKA